METRYDAVLMVGGQPCVIADAGEGKVSMTANGFTKRDVSIADVEAFAYRLLDVAGTSKRIPKEEGYYWWRGSCNDDWEVVFVNIQGNRQILHQAGVCIPCFMDSLPAGMEWGPRIEEPC